MWSLNLFIHISEETRLLKHWKSRKLKTSIMILWMLLVSLNMTFCTLFTSLRPLLFGRLVNKKFDVIHMTSYLLYRIRFYHKSIDWPKYGSSWLLAFHLRCYFAVKKGLSLLMKYSFEDILQKWDLWR